MIYSITGIELHPDKGFGVTADSYYQSAEILLKNQAEEDDYRAQVEMPQNFLYRHSIELYLKSLIILFHRKLKINYGSVSFDSDDPEVLINGKWKKLYTCHFIDVLYDYWLSSLLIPNILELESIAPIGDWKEDKEITQLFNTICKYDKDSAFFRYPLSKNSSLDDKKYTMQKFNPNTKLCDFVKKPNVGEKSGKGSYTMLVVDDADNIVNAYKHVDNVLPEVRNALKKVAFYFHCIHIMARITLFDGN